MSTDSQRMIEEYNWNVPMTLEQLKLHVDAMIEEYGEQAIAKLVTRKTSTFFDTVSLSMRISPRTSRGDT